MAIDVPDATRWLMPAEFGVLPAGITYRGCVNRVNQ